MIFYIKIWKLTRLGIKIIIYGKNYNKKKTKLLKIKIKKKNLIYFKINKYI